MTHQRYSIPWQKKAIAIMDMIRSAEALEEAKKYDDACKLHATAAKMAEELRIGEQIVLMELRRAEKALKCSGGHMG